MSNPAMRTKWRRGGGFLDAGKRHLNLRLDFWFLAD
jgi:hypothetical protein